MSLTWTINYAHTLALCYFLQLSLPLLLLYNKIPSLSTFLNSLHSSTLVATPLSSTLAMAVSRHCHRHQHNHHHLSALTAFTFLLFFSSSSSTSASALSQLGSGLQEMEEGERGTGLRSFDRVLSHRKLGGPGSSPPSCRSKCGNCSPCKPVHVPIQPGFSTPLEYYPEAWRCKCGNKLFMP